ncbi:MAG: bifunctional acetaldehyde-CoA/alcohol dehydrogenase [Defluviitaleaceae bacterium]|nr:bifunctional acetaldehyde-CoA/alcohol dehydrogenase [Defluviitaleaceae bacterium]
MENFKDLLAPVKAAADIYRGYTQEQVDKIFKAAALAAADARIPLAKMANEESGLGIVEDKVIKNHYAAEYTYNKYKDMKTCGLIEEDVAAGIRKIAEPLGVIAALIPITNPTSTVMFKILLALKTRNGIILCPHPKGKNCVAETARIMLKAAEEAGAPKGIISWVTEPSKEATQDAMTECDFTLATGGPGMVKAAYSSGKPAIGVGAGNTPVIIDDSADVKMTVSSILLSKTFDNGVVCSSEQSLVVVDSIYDAILQEFTDRGAHICSKDEMDKLRGTIMVNGFLNAAIVGQPAWKIAEMAGFEVPKSAKVLLAQVKGDVDRSDAFAYEKLSPVLAMYRANGFDKAIDMAAELVDNGGLGHTSAIYIDYHAQKEKLTKFENRMKTCRILVNTPTSHGAIGDLYNFALPPSMTLGCGTWGGNSVSENVGPKHLLNVKTVAIRRENMLWFRTPEKVYYKMGSLAVALDELRTHLHKKRVFIVTDKFLASHGMLKPVTDLLNEKGIQFSVFSDVEPDPTLASAKAGAAQMEAFKPDCIIAFGGGSPMDAAKIMWLLYEHPDTCFEDMALRFMDIRKRVYTFPKMGEKAYFIAIPTTAGTGSEVTPFAVITDEKTDKKYPIADYELMPHMAIVDANLMMHMPKGLTAASGFDVLSHAVEAYVSMLATPYTDGLAIEAIKLTFKYLGRAYQNGAADPEARDGMANASCIAGMAFANAFLGICHSLSHKLGAATGLPHGICNAIILPHVVRFNAADTPTKMGAFSQYTHPHASDRYAQIADALGLGGKTKEDKINKLIKAMAELKTTLEINPTIKGHGIKEKEFMGYLDQIAEDAFDDQCTGSNPRYPLISELKQIYIDAFHGK